MSRQRSTTLSTLLACAKVLGAATAAVAVAGETVAIDNKLRDEGARPLKEYATGQYDQGTDAPEDEQSFPSRLAYHSDEIAFAMLTRAKRYAMSTLARVAVA